MEDWTTLQPLVEASVKIPLDYFYCPYWFLQIALGSALIVGVLVGVYMGWKVGSHSVQ